MGDPLNFANEMIDRRFQTSQDFLCKFDLIVTKPGFNGMNVLSPPPSSLLLCDESVLKNFFALHSYGDLISFSTHGLHDSH